MLKMTIDNEEVLSNNDISIKEEILSPSSTILNNVYPKSWEQDKDYVSRFYYPKDYSKLNIQNFSVEPEEAGTTIQINGSATLTDVDTTKESRVLRILGQTSQKQYTGKNLLKYPYSDTTKTTNGITFTDNGDGSITINGTSTGQAIFYLKSNGWSFDSSSVLPTGTYTFNKLATNNNVFFYINIYKNDGTNQTYSTSTGNTTFNITGTQSLNMPRIAVASGVTLNNVRVYPQLEAGSSATSFEPYVGGTASPNPSYPQNVNVVSGDNEINICGKNLLPNAWTSGSISGSTGQPVLFGSRIYTTNKIKVQPSTSYTIHNHNTSSYNIINIIDGYDKNGTFIGRIGQFNGNANGYVLTTQATCEYINITLNNTSDSMTYALFQTYLSNGTLQPQLEKGSTATTYEPYIGNTYPLYLGVENLYNYTYFTSATNNGITATNNNGVITCSGTSTNTSFLNISTQQGKIPLKANVEYTLSANNTTSLSSNDFLRLMDTNGTTIQNTTITLNSSNAKITFTLSQDTEVLLQLRFGTGETITNFIIKPQLEIGSKANHYTPYGTTPIELCKIGTYQDYIYKEDGSWYLHKEIGKVVLDGSEQEWGYTQTGGINRFTTNAMPKISNYIKGYSDTNRHSDRILCTHFKGNTTDAIGNMYQYQRTILFDANSDITSTSLWLTWLSNNLPTLYFVLETPTNTEITDTTLLEQLESLSS